MGIRFSSISGNDDLEIQVIDEHDHKFNLDYIAKLFNLRISDLFCLNRLIRDLSDLSKSLEAAIINLNKPSKVYPTIIYKDKKWYTEGLEYNKPTKLMKFISDGKQDIFYKDLIGKDTKFYCDGKSWTTAIDDVVLTWRGQDLIDNNPPRIIIHNINGYYSMLVNPYRCDYFIPKPTEPGDFIADGTYALIGDKLYLLDYHYLNDEDLIKAVDNTALNDEISLPFIYANRLSDYNILMSNINQLCKLSGYHVESIKLKPNHHANRYSKI